MTPWRSVTEFCTAVHARADNGDLSAALEMILGFAVRVISHESSFGVVFSSSELDELVQDISRRRDLTIGLPDHEQTVFLTTALYPTGGHSRVLLDLIEADASPRTTILVSNTDHDVPADEPRTMFDFKGATVEVAPAGALSERLRWMQSRLAALRPARTYLLTHQYDPVCVGAAQPELTGQLIYYHHCDHHLALGVHLPHAIHVDFHAKGFHRCREVEGIQSNVYWPLTVQVDAHRADRPFLRSGNLTTCTSGGIAKFDNTRLLERLPYVYDYTAIVPQIIEATGGAHLHIGGLSDDMLARIRLGLSALGLGQDRFIYLPYAPTLAQPMLEHDVDIYVGSFPLGGGRTLVEVMGAGFPMMLHSNYRSVFFTDVGEAYPGVFSWRHTDELVAQLGALDQDDLAEHARRSRAHYEAYHAPPLLGEAVRATLRGQRPTPPPAAPYRPDALQTWLDVRNANSPERETLEARLEAARTEADLRVAAARAEGDSSVRDAEARIATLTADLQYVLAERAAVRESIAWPIFSFLEKQTRGLTRAVRSMRRPDSPS